MTLDIWGPIVRNVARETNANETNETSSTMAMTMKQAKIELEGIRRRIESLAGNVDPETGELLPQTKETLDKLIRRKVWLQRGIDRAR